MCYLYSITIIFKKIFGMPALIFLYKKSRRLQNFYYICILQK
jgi:hypothetical protein